MPLTITAKCPSCGGVMEFEEGAGAVSCPSCGSGLLMTGRGRVLAYYIPETIDANQAVAAAREGFRALGEHGWRPNDATLFFVPFFHYSARVLRWEIQETVISVPEGRTVKAKSLGAVRAEELFDVISASSESGGAKQGEKKFELVARLSERSLPALDTSALGVFPFCIRPGVLRFSAFMREALTPGGLVAPVRSSAADSDEEAFPPDDSSELFSRAVFDRHRSLVYLPFWVVEVARVGREDKESGRAFTVVDGVAGTVTSQKAPVSLLDSLVDMEKQEFERQDLRPLNCPDCGSELFAGPGDALFICTGCGKLWRLSGEEFTEIPYTIAAPTTKRNERPEYLPFWVVRTKITSGGQVVDNKFDLPKLSPGLTWPKEEDKQVPLRFFLPAFRMGNLKALSRVAANFTRFQPVFTPSDNKDFTMLGAYLSPDDALEIAPLLIFSLIPKGNRNAVRFALEATVEAIEAELVLVPYYRGKFEMTDAIFGNSFPIAAFEG